MTNRKLRKALLEKLGITPQGLSYRVSKIKLQCPMSTEEATYVIAHKEGFPLDKYLDEPMLARVRQHLLHISPQGPRQKSDTGRARRGRAAEKKQNVIKIGKERDIVEPILPRRKINEASDMAKIYPLLYILENSIRELVDRVMTSQFGSKWWDSQAPKNIRRKVADRMTGDKKHEWHQRRGGRPIDYIDLPDLPRVLKKIEKHVIPDILPDFQWFDQLVKEVNRSRCVVCHMNPLNKMNIKSVEVKFEQWEKQVKAKKARIPEVKS